MFKIFGRRKRPTQPAPHPPPQTRVVTDSRRRKAPGGPEPVLTKDSEAGVRPEPAASNGVSDKLALVTSQIADRLHPIIQDQMQHQLDHIFDVTLQQQTTLAEQINSIGERITNAAVARMGEETHSVQKLIEDHLAPLTDRVEHSLEATIADRFSAFTEQMQSTCSATARQAVLRPVIDAILALLDRIGKDRAFLTTWYRRDPELALHLGARQLYERYDSTVQSFCTEIYIILRALDVHPLNCGAGRFNPRTQKIVEVEATKNPELDGHIVRIFRGGFIWGDMVLCPEQVVVFKKES